MKHYHLLFLFLLGPGFALLFELKWYYLVFIILLYLFFLKKIKEYRAIQAEELEKFQQINAYMSQVSQCFVRTKNILSSLQETRDTFSEGTLRTHLGEAIDIILLEGGDIVVAQRKSLLRLETEYHSERLHTLHEFMLLAEQQGGSCKREFVLLEKMRLAWEGAVLKYHDTLIENRNLTTLLYILMLGICVFVLHAFPKDLSIIHFEFVQFTNLILSSLLILFFTVLDKQICGVLFQQPKNLNTSKEIAIAFPKWLFDLMLLMQRESVESAILHSISTAPPVLQTDLENLSQLLLQYPGEISVFTSFLSQYNLPQIETNMRKLYALSIGVEEKEESVNFLIESNMDSLMQAEEKSYIRKGGLSSLFQFIPLLCVSLGMLIYCVAIILVSLSRISSLFQ